MVTLTDFLLARIAEDEKVARRRIQFGEGRVSSMPEVMAPRMLAECEAKRRIVEEWREAADATSYPRTKVLGPVLRILAAVYADHPDYREEWRV